jgi:phosphate transport system protein
MEISYGFSRFGRYAYDIVDVLETLGYGKSCDKTAVLEMAKTVREMILLSVRGLEIRDNDASAKLYEMDDSVDALYRRYLREIIARDGQAGEKTDLRCCISVLLILRYLERISDHACYIGDSIRYSTTGISSPRR